MKFISKIILFCFLLQIFSSGLLDVSYASDTLGSHTVGIEIQSGLEKNSEYKYICKKETCKVNLTVEAFFEEKNIKDYSCIWDFGDGTFTTKDTDKKCNPGFVSYFPGKHNIAIQIFRNTDNMLISENFLSFENNFYSENYPEAPIEDTSDALNNLTHDELLDNIGQELFLDFSEETILSGITQVGRVSQEEKGIPKIENSEKIVVPEIVFEIQSGLEYVGISTGNIYYCKTEECKVNLSVEDIFTADYDEKDYQCHWNFGSGTFSTTNTDKKCNPGFVTFGTGTHEVFLEVKHEQYPEKFSTGSLIIIHDFDTKIVSPNLYREKEEDEGEIVGEQNDVTLTIPEIVFEIQSGLEYVGTSTGNIYYCKTEECKVNLSVEDIFTADYEEKDYQCHWNFGSGTFSTVDTDKKCNPGFVSFGTGTHEVSLEIKHEQYPEKSSTGALIIIHDFHTKNILLSEVSKQNSFFSNLTGRQNVEDKNLSDNISLSGATQDNITITEAKLLYENFEILEILQQPSYIEKNGDSYICDTSREECKVNLDFKISSNDSEITGVNCKIYINSENDFLETCNPNTHIFPVGENHIKIEVYTKESVLLGIKELIINNSGYKEESKLQTNNIQNIDTQNNDTAEDKIRIGNIKIDVQSGLDEYDNCKKQDCKVNLIYENQPGEKCFWKFPGGIYREPTTKKCNPGYVNYPEYGEYTITLRVYDENYQNNFREKIFHLGNYDSSDIDLIEEALEEQDTEENLIQEEYKTKFIISLQGKKTDYKLFSGSTILCSQSPCNINLDGSKSTRSNGEKVNLSWDNNGSIYVGNNPKSSWYQAGEYSIRIYDGDNSYTLQLIVNGDTINTAEAILEGEDKTEDIFFSDDFEIDENLKKYLKISAILPNPEGIDSNEYIELINTGNFPINLLGLKIDDILDAGSKAFIIDHEYILQENETVKFYKYQTDINLNNTTDSVHLVYGEDIIDSLEYDFPPPDNYLLTHINTSTLKDIVYVSQIIDGDTIEVTFQDGTKERIRLIGIDTPEIYNVRDNSLEKKYGLQAKYFLQTTILGKNISLQYENGKTRDSYERLLGFVFYNDKNINQSIIENGYSRSYNVYTHKYSKLFSRAETNAKKEKLGIWGSTSYKKIVLAQIRNDKEIIEILEQEEAYEKKLTFYQDVNKDNIPDIFQKGYDKDADKLGAYNTYVQNSFYLKISKLQAGIKLSGKSIPSASLLFTIGDETFFGKAEASGEFSIPIGNHFGLGSYDIKIDITDIYGNDFMIDKAHNFEIDGDYIQKLQQVALKKAQKALLAARKAALKAARKSKKSASSGRKIYSNVFIKKANAYSDSIDANVSQSSKILTNIVIILSLFMIFLVLRRKKLV